MTICLSEREDGSNVIYLNEESITLSNMTRILGRPEVRAFDIPYQDLDTYILALTVIRNAQELGVDIRDYQIYRYDDMEGFYRLGIYEHGVFVPLGRFMDTSVDQRKKNLKLFTEIPVDQKKLTVWPPPKAEEKHLLEPITSSLYAMECTKCGQQFGYSADIHSPCPGKKE